MQFNVDPNLNNQFNNRKRIILDTCSNLRALGREHLNGYWFMGALVMFLFTLMIRLPVAIIDGLFGRTVTINLGRDLKLGDAYNDVTYTVTSSPMSNVYTLLVVGALSFGMTLFIMNVYRRKQAGVGDLFRGFEFYVRATGLFLYQLLFIMLWFMIPLVGIVTGIMASIRYSMSYFVMLDHPEYTIPMCVNESKRLMFGNKMKYFTLQLSFIGWFILASVPAFILGGVGAWMTYQPGSTGGAMVVYELVSIVSMVAIYPVMAYSESASMAFYEILIGNEEAEVYYPETRTI